MNIQKSFPGPFLLCILDGFGISDHIKGNAIAAAKTPNWDKILKTHPHAKLVTHGRDVGLPEGQMGNSEVGHMTIGSGRVHLQPLEQIQEDLNSGRFAQKNTVQAFMDKAQEARAIHLIGMVSDGGVHSHMNHAIGIAKLLNDMNQPVFIHAITDGRDTDPKAAKIQLPQFEEQIKDLDNVHIATLSGRFYTMDRDTRWERTEKAYYAMTEAHGHYANNTAEAIEKSYADGDTDEFIEPTILNVPAGLDPRIQQDDALLFFNFRADRMRQIVRCFTNDPTVGFKHGHLHRLKTIATMTMYDEKFKHDASVLYPPTPPQNTLGEVVCKNGGSQLRIAETEKYAHVTYYLNGGREEPFDKEERILVPSPRDVKSYDQIPEMSLPEVTGELTEAIYSNKFDFIALNIANGDMVGHCGDFAAAVDAVEAIDYALGSILNAIEAEEGEMLIIADHGNVEEMQMEGKTSTSHSTNPVPCVYIGRNATVADGTLADVAPTVLRLMGLDVPKDMTGRNLVSLT